MIIVYVYKISFRILKSRLVHRSTAQKMLFQQRRDKELPLMRMHPIVGREKGAHSPSPNFSNILKSFYSLQNYLYLYTDVYERCKHASNDFTVAAVPSSAIPRLYNSYQRLTRYKIAKKEKEYIKHTFLPLRKTAARALVFRDTMHATFMGFQRSKKFHQRRVLCVTLFV